MSERLTNEAIVDTALQALRDMAMPLGEVFLREAQSGSVEIKDGAIESVIARGERGVGIRVIDEQRLGFAYTSDLSADGIRGCADTARRMSAVTERDIDLVLATCPLDDADLDIYQAGIVDRALGERGAVALAVEEAARATDARVTQFRKTTYSDSESTTMIATTGGVRGSFRESYCGAMTSAVATENGDRQIGYHGEAGRRFAELEPRRIGERAARRAAEKLGAKPLATQKLPVVLDPWMAMDLLRAIGPLFSADNVLKGRSLFANKVGQRVANERITVIDDARRPRGLRSAPFDGEGVATTTRVLIEGGTLRGYLTSLKTARKLGLDATGNARRGGYGSPARVGTSNLFIDAGVDDTDAAVRGLDRALAVTSLLNLHTIDPVSGEFSLGATGNYLERGERIHPVQGITIAGNLTDLLNAVVGVGSDLVFGPGGLGSPTIVISELSIGGA
ncbi:MAG: TldD/PmbA family protein [Chloroflexi bacterium]|nr:MAG: TldD/PmbA family protein [Chloroflexota bacterium]